MCSVKEASPRETNTVGLHLPEAPRVVRFVETESRVVAAWGWGEGNGEFEFHGDRASAWEDEEVLETVVGMAAPRCEGTQRC